MALRLQSVFLEYSVHNVSRSPSKKQAIVSIFHFILLKIWRSSRDSCKNYRISWEQKTERTLSLFISRACAQKKAGGYFHNRMRMVLKQCLGSTILKYIDFLPLLLSKISRLNCDLDTSSTSASAQCTGTRTHFGHEFTSINSNYQMCYLPSLGRSCFSSAIKMVPQFEIRIQEASVSFVRVRILPKISIALAFSWHAEISIEQDRFFKISCTYAV